MSQHDVVDVSDSGDPSAIPRLTRYARASAAEADIRECAPLRGSALVDAFRPNDHRASAYRSTEALIALARRAVALGDKRATQGLFELLIGRCQMYFRQAMRGVRDAEERIAIQEQILEDVISGVMRAAPQDEFMQARFGRWLKLRMFRRIAEAKQRRARTQLLDDIVGPDNEGDRTRLEEIASREISAEQWLLLGEGLAVLPEPLRELYILRHFAGWSVGDDRKSPAPGDEPTLAEHYGISARAITKRLARAEACLESYRKDSA